METRLGRDGGFDACRWAAWLGIAAGLVVIVEQVIVRLRFNGSGEPLWIGVAAVLFDLLVRAGIPWAGAALVLRGRQVVLGLGALVAIGLIQVPTVVGMTWQTLVLGMPPWFWFSPALLLAAAVTAAVGWLGLGIEGGPLRLDGGRGLAAGGAVLLAAAVFFPSVELAGEPGVLAGLVAGPFFGPWPYVLFDILRVAAFVILAWALLALRQVEGPRAVAAVLTLVAVTDVAYALVSVASPLMQVPPALAIRPGMLLSGLAAALVGLGCAALWRPRPA